MHDIEMCFSIQGFLIPRNYYYCLYASLTTLLPILKENTDWAISRISNTTAFDNLSIKLSDSILKIRCNRNLVTALAVLFGENTLVIGKTDTVVLKFIYSSEILPRQCLSSHVTIKTEENRNPDPISFAVCLGKQLAKLNINTLPTVGGKEYLLIKKMSCTVYPVLFKSLHPEESIALQCQGIGVRKHFGCGFFD